MYCNRALVLMIHLYRNRAKRCVYELLRISRRGRGGRRRVRFRNLRVASLLFADGVVTLAPSSQDLQCALGGGEFGGLEEEPGHSGGTVSLRLAWERLDELEEETWVREEGEEEDIYIYLHI